MSEPNKEAIRLLAEALESDRFQQGRQYLFKDGRHCCLGVACVLAWEAGVIPMLPWEAAVTGANSTLPEAVRKWYGFEDNNPVIGSRPIEWDDDDYDFDDGESEEEDVFAIMANDRLEWDFPTIAQAFRTHYQL